MAGADNLKKPRSTEEAREWGRRGGIASGKARREKKTMQEVVQMFLHKPLDDKEVEEFSSIKDIKGKNLEAMTAIIAVQVQKALGGDLQAAAFLRDTAGEKPVEKVEVNADLAKASADIDARIQAMKARHADDGC